MAQIQGTTIGIPSQPIGAGEIGNLKSRLQKTWMAGDYDRFSRYMEQGARSFYEQLDICAGCELLDVAWSGSIISASQEEAPHEGGAWSGAIKTGNRCFSPLWSSSMSAGSNTRREKKGR